MLEHTQELLDLHTDLLERFREATKPQPKIKLSQIFIDFRERFLIYGDYCSKLTLATDTLRDFCKNDNTISDLVNVSIHFQIETVSFNTTNILSHEHSDAKKTIRKENVNYVISYQCQCNEY